MRITICTWICELIEPGNLTDYRLSRSEQSKHKFDILLLSFVSNFLPKLYAIVICIKDWFEFIAVVIRKRTRKEIEILKLGDPLSVCFFFFFLTSLECNFLLNMLSFFLYWRIYVWHVIASHLSMVLEEIIQEQNKDFFYFFFSFVYTLYFLRPQTSLLKMNSIAGKIVKKSLSKMCFLIRGNTLSASI